MKYHQGTVNRPTVRLVRLLKNSEQVPTKGHLFDDHVVTDREIHKDLQEQEQGGQENNCSEGGEVQEEVETVDQQASVQKVKSDSGQLM